MEKKTLNTIGAVLQVGLTLVGVAILAVVVYYSVRGPYNLIGAILISICGLFLARFVYNMIMQRGLLSAMTGDNASYELDNIHPVGGSDTYLLSVEEFVLKVASGDVVIPRQVSICIWGDSLGRSLDESHTIDTVTYNDEQRVLAINFEGGHSCKLRAPRQVLFSERFIKVLYADEIMWKLVKTDKKIETYSYLYSNKEIQTASNTPWKPKKYQVGAGKDALYLQG